MLFWLRLYSSGARRRPRSMCLTQRDAVFTEAWCDVGQSTPSFSRSEWLDQHSAVLDRRHGVTQRHVSRSTDGRRRRAHAPSLLPRRHRPSSSSSSPSLPSAAAAAWSASVVHFTSSCLWRLRPSTNFAAVSDAVGRHRTVGRPFAICALRRYWTLGDCADDTSEMGSCNTWKNQDLMHSAELL